MMKQIFQKLYSLLILLILFFFMFRNCNVITIKNAYAAEKPQQITVDEMKQIAIDLFSVKCGIPRSVISESDINIIDEDDSFEVLIKSFARPYDNHDGCRVRIPADAPRTQRSPGGKPASACVWGFIRKKHIWWA